jgi:molybdenum cofactor biosynthesis protein B
MVEPEPGALRVLTVTISDLRKRFADEAGKRLDAELANGGFAVVRHAMVADEPDHIRDLVRTVATGNAADAIILAGGTGITPRDQTLEALEALYDKRIDGFGESFRRLAFETMGPRSMYFRASAGVIEQVPVFSLPGNAQAVLLGIRHLIIPTLQHAVALATGQDTHTVGPARDRTSSRDVSQARPSDASSSTDLSSRPDRGPASCDASLLK